MPFLCFDRFELPGLRSDARNAPAFKRRFFRCARLQSAADFVCADDCLLFAESRFGGDAGTEFGNRKTAVRRDLGFRHRFVDLRFFAQFAVLSVHRSRALKNKCASRNQ